MIANATLGASTPPGSGGHHRLWLWSLLAAALAARLPNLGESLWFDEVVYTSVGLGPGSLDRVLFRDVHPPLYALIMLGWTRLFGDSEIAVRVPSLLFGMASLGIVFALARSWFGGRVALVALALLAAAPAHIWYSQENKVNMLAVLLTALAVCGLQRAWSSDRRRDWALFAAASVLALWTHAFASFVVASTLVWPWLQVARTGRRRLPRALAASVLIALAWAPLVVATLRQLGEMGRDYLRPFTLTDLYNLLLVYLSHGNTLHAPLAVATPAALLEQHGLLLLVDGFYGFLLFRGGVVLVREWRAERGQSPDGISARGQARELLLLYLLVPLACALLASLVRPQIYVERSLLVLTVPFAMLVARGATGFDRPARSVLVGTCLALLGAGALYNLWVAKADTWNVYKPNPDWRTAAVYFKDELTKAEGRLVIVATGPARVLVDYYHPRLIEPPGESPAGQPRRLVVHYADGRGLDPIYETLRRHDEYRFYVLRTRFWGGGFRLLLAALRRCSNCALEDVRSFKGLDVLKVRLVGPAPGS